MNIVLFEPSEIVEQRTVVTDERARHIAKILRAAPGDSIRVGVVNGLIGQGIIRNINRRPPYTVELHVLLNEPTPPPSRVDIVLALPRPIMFKRVLSQATTLGVKNFYIINANRVEKSFWDAHAIEQDTCRSHLLKGLEQAVDTCLPSLHFHRGFKSFIETEIPSIKRDYDHLIVADPRYKKSVQEVVEQTSGRVLLAVGPEGGWVDYEIDKMVASGFKGLGIGSRILRVDTAVIALHSILAS